MRLMNRAQELQLRSTTKYKKKITYLYSNRIGFLWKYFRCAVHNGIEQIKSTTDYVIQINDYHFADGVGDRICGFGSFNIMPVFFSLILCEQKSH